MSSDNIVQLVPPKRGRATPRKLYLASYRLGPKGAQRTALLEAEDQEHAYARFTTWYPYHYSREDYVLVSLTELPRLTYVELHSSSWTISSWDPEDEEA